MSLSSPPRELRKGDPFSGLAEAKDDVTSLEEDGISLELDSAFGSWELLLSNGVCECDRG